MSGVGLLLKTSHGLLVISSLFLTSILAISPSFATNVVYTYAVADHGQGGWGGGPLFADGTAGGSQGVSFENGANVAHFKASSWYSGTSLLTGGPGVDICGTLTVLKSNGGLPPPGVYPGFCLSFALGTLIPITGHPVVVCMAGACTTIRVTPVG
jgi:hypothetical protein